MSMGIGRLVVFCRDAPGREQRGARGDDEGPAGSRERLAQRLDRAPVRRGGGGEVSGSRMS